MNTSRPIRLLLLAPVLGLLAAPAAALDALETARSMGDALVSAARKQGPGLRWPQYDGGPPTLTEAKRHFPLSFYSGSTGTGWFLLNLYRVTGEKKYLDAAKGAGLHLVATAKPLSRGGLQWSSTYERKDRSIPDGEGMGLYTGNAGIGLFLLQLFAETKDERFRKAGVGAFERILNEVLEDKGGHHWVYASKDIIGGEAGIGLALLQAHAITGDARIRDAAAKAAVWLRALAERDAAGCRWETYKAFDPNFSHGTAGIAFFLGALGDDENAAAARESAAWIRAQGKPCDGGLEWSYYAEPLPEGKSNRMMNSWCHGAPGTVRLFLLLHRTTGAKALLDTASAGGGGILNQMRWGKGEPFYYNPTYCCGAAGCLDAFVSLYRAGAGERWLETARTLAAHMAADFRARGKGVLHADYDTEDEQAKKHPYFPCGFMTGNAGVAMALLHLGAVEAGKADRLLLLPDHPFAALFDAAAVPPREGGEAEPAAPAEEPAVGSAYPGFEALRARAAGAWTGENPAAGAYLVLLPEGSPLKKAAETLARHRKAEIVAYSPAAPDGCLETLIAKKARWAAIFVEPADMDVNLLRSFIVLSTLLDDDPFCDMAFGFVTASTPAQAEAFVDRMIEADRRGVNRVTAQFAVSNLSRTYPGSSFLDGVPGDSHYVKLGDVEFGRKSLQALGKAGFVHIGGCGDPEGVWLFDDARNLDAAKHWPFDPAKVGQDPEGAMPRLLARDVRDAMKLDRAVVWTHVCHIGTVGRMWVEGDIVSTFGACEKVEEYRVPPERSVALAVIEAGASAYIAPLGANFGAQSNIEQDFASETGAPLGDVLRRAYHDVVMDSGGHPEAIGLFVTGKPAHWEPDAFVNNNSPQHRVLYGDPLLKPFGDFRSPPTVEIAAEKKDKGLALSFRVLKSGYLGRTWYGNRGRANAGRGRIYETVELKEAPASVRLVRAEGLLPSGEGFVIARSSALVEKVDGKVYLHVQLVTDDPKALSTEGSVVKVFADFSAAPAGGGEEKPAAPAEEPAAGSAEEAYVILTNLAEGDPFDAVTRIVMGMHPEAKVLRFSGADPTAAAAELRALKPRFVAVPVKPGDLDIHFQGRMLDLCVSMDEDPFCDFSFGYFTGATAEEAAAFARAAARAWKAERPERILTTPTVGGAEPSRFEMSAKASYGVDWPMVRINFGERDGKALEGPAVRAWFQANLKDFAGNGVVYMGGHGSPTGIHGNMSGADFRALKPDLFPAVVYNYACMTGCTGRVFGWIQDRTEVMTVKTHTVDPKESIALAILASGAPAYVASIEPRPAGPGMMAEFHWALHAGLTLGEVRRREYDMLALAFLSWGEKGLVTPRYVEGAPRNRADGVRDIMMMDASGTVLFGDPAWAPFEKGDALLETALEPDGDGRRLRARWVVGAAIQGYDPYRTWKDGRTMANRFYASVALPADVPAVTALSVHSVADGSGTALEHDHLAWAVERRGPERLLHVKVNCPPRSMLAPGATAVFRINPAGGAPPEPPEESGADGEKKPGTEDKSEGPSEVEKALSTEWHLGRREWVLKDFVAFVEKFLSDNQGQYGWGQLTFAFDDDARFALEKKVMVDLRGVPLRRGLDGICKALGLTLTVDKEADRVRFSKGPASGGGEEEFHWRPGPRENSRDASQRLQALLREFPAAVSESNAAAYRVLLAVGRLRTEEAARALVKIYAQNKEYALKVYILTALRTVDGKPAAEGLLEISGAEENVAYRRMVLQSLGDLGAEGAAEALVAKGLAHKAADVRVAAALALGSLRWPGAVAPLVRAAKDRAPEVRAAAAEALGRIATAETVQPLIDLASAADERAAVGALWALRDSRMTDPRIGAFARALLTARRASVGRRVQAMLVIGALGDPDGAGFVIPFLEDREEALRSAAVEALGLLRAPESVEPLIARLEKEGGLLLMEVSQALYRISGIDIGTNVRLWRDWWGKSREGFVPPPIFKRVAAGADITVSTYHGIPVVSKRIVFVLDHSGSMSAAAGAQTRLDLCKGELVKVIRGLPRDAMFNIVAFETGVKAMEKTLVLATPANKELAAKFVEARTPMGGTNMADALKAAFEDKAPNTFYVLSDGAPNTPAEEILRWVREANASRRAIVHAISVGSGGGTFLSALAKEHRGRYVALE